MSDLISREDALQCKPEFLNPNPNDKPNNYPIGWNDAIKVWYADIKSLPSADAVPQLKQTDTLIIADALRYLAQDTERHLSDRTRADALRQQFLKYGSSMCRSADAVQGEWILVKGSNGKDYHKCSKCLHTQEITGVKNYCAVCGARMKGGDDE